LEPDALTEVDAVMVPAENTVDVRPPSGWASFYMDAFILRQRFIGNLTIRADFDVGIFYRLFCYIGGDQRVKYASVELLPQLRKSLTTEAYDLYKRWRHVREQVAEFVERRRRWTAGLPQEQKRATPVYELLLDLHTEYQPAFEAVGIETLGDFETVSEGSLRELGQLGTRDIEKIEGVLASMGLGLAR
jgi:hypothetical protein